jgi:glutaconate CoA-transferase, subunit A
MYVASLWKYDHFHDKLLRKKMASLLTVNDLAELTPEGVRLGVGGVHLARLPLALIRRILELGRKDFVFTSWGGGLALELLLEAQAVRKLIFCFSSLDIFGLAPRFREALERHTIEVEEWSALAMVQGLHAAHFNLPNMPFQLPVGSDLMRNGDFWMQSLDAFSGTPLGLARRLDLDVLLLHAQRADLAGNVEIQGARGLDLSLIGAAKKVLVTVEEIVPTGQLGNAPRSFVLPREFVMAVAKAPWGAYPTSCLPYYTTDYGALLDYVSDQQSRRKKGEVDPTGPGGGTNWHWRRFVPDDSRKSFLSSCARIRAEDLVPELFEPRMPVAGGSSYTVDELMTVALAREYDNSSICSVGSVSPLAMVSYLLAKKTHAPNLTIIALNGGFIDIDVHPMSLTLAEPLEFATAKVCWGGDETYHWYYQQGRITHEVITVAQIDLHGRTNNAWIKSGDKVLRLPGQGGMADVANLHKNFTLYLTRHSPERFVSAVEFCTASRGLYTAEERTAAGLQAGSVRLISDLGIFELDLQETIFRLVSIHPGVTLETVRSQTGGEFLVAEPLPQTKPPSFEELRIIREEIDPLGIRRLEFVPGRDRLGMIESILQAESELIQRVLERTKALL